MKELTYTRCGDYYIPDLKLSEQPEVPIGKYGRMRQRYLKEHRPGLYSLSIPPVGCWSYFDIRMAKVLFLF